MNSDLFIQYSDVKEEIKDIRKRIGKLEKFLSDPHQVSDTVKGTRRDGIMETSVSPVIRCRSIIPGRKCWSF